MSIELTDLCQLTLLNAGLTQSLSKFDLSGLCDLVELTVAETKLRRIELDAFPYLKNVYVDNNPELSFLAVKSCEKCELIVVSKNDGLETIQLLGVRDDLDIECDRKEIHVETDRKTLGAMLVRREFDVKVVEPKAIDGAP